MFDRKQAGERALVVQTRRRAGEIEAAEEFRELVASAGATMQVEIWAKSDHPNPRFFVGTGKADEIKTLVAEQDLDLVIVNHQLSPVQERNLEAYVQARVVDRTGLILDIFSQRARSHEGKLEVELAQLRHIATRLVRGWTHLERQRGGIGNRGPGETQLETDRRLLSKRVKVLSDRLDVAVRQREQGRKGRSASGVPQVALVGYTNAGKSTLFNTLTKSKVYAADQLFATLDPTVRRVRISDETPPVTNSEQNPADYSKPNKNAGIITLADTVGFVSDLPHELVAAFRSTLTEAREAELLLHIIDAADPMLQERMEDVDKVLEEIGAASTPKLIVMNKIDLTDQLPRFERGERPRVWVSAHTGAGMKELKLAIAELVGV
jgi:GTPase